MNIVQELLSKIGNFSSYEVAQFDEIVVRRNFIKDDILLKEGDVGKYGFYIISGEAYHFLIKILMRKLLIYTLKMNGV